MIIERHIRESAFAGKFYPGKKDELEKLIARLAKVEASSIKSEIEFDSIIGGVVPHAGFIYSGYQAVHFYELLAQSKQQIDTVVIINPNHTGYGKGNFNISGAHAWETPLGLVECDHDFIENTGIEQFGPAHSLEHSGEVHLPFLQYYLKHNFKIAVITMNKQNAENARVLAKTIFDAAQKSSKNIIVIASSDFTHFESPVESARKDKLLINEILGFNTDKIEETVHCHKISTCGFGPAMVLVEYARMCCNNARSALLKYGNSGDVYPSDKVVAYASILFYR